LTSLRALEIRRLRCLQPIAELERKAAKARRRAGRFTMEDADLSIARSDARWKAEQERLLRKPAPLAMCWYCHAFGKRWDDKAKVYRGFMQHSAGCFFAPLNSRYDPSKSISEGSVHGGL
jgi:hypothetical protein